MNKPPKHPLILRYTAEDVSYITVLVVGSAAEWIAKAAPADLVIVVSLMVMGSTAERIAKSGPSSFSYSCLLKTP